MREAPAALAAPAPAAVPWRIDRQVTLAVVVAVVAQAGGALAWAGGASERIAALEQRLDRQAGVNERLARLEAQADNSRAALARIEALLDARESRR